MKKSILFMFLCCMGIFAFAQKTYTVKEVPNPKQVDGGWVSDPDGFLSAEDKASLNQSITEIENKTTAQIAIVILSSIGDEVPKTFTTKLFEEWDIGQMEKDNGLLILTVIDQRRTEFEPGYGLEGILTDADLFRLGTKELIPHFKKGDYGAGLIAVVNKIKKILEQPEAVNEIYDDGNGIAYDKQRNSIFNYLYVYLALLLFAIYYFFSTIRKINVSKEDFYDKYQNLNQVKHWIYMILFPLPFLFIRWMFVRLRLKKYRNHRRFSKVNGKEMFKLSEKAEDVFLDTGQIKEEEINSVDYDVWATKDKDDYLILSYPGRVSKYKKCPRCKYKTYHLARTKVIQRATSHSTGLRHKTYICKNCHYQKIHEVVIPMITSSSGSGGSFGGGSGGGFGGSFGGGSSGGGGAGVGW